jgi:hypothetical protein
MSQTHWIVFAISLLLSITAWTQEVPKAKLGFDGSYLRYAPNVPGSNGHSFNGDGGSLVLNINQYFGIKADLQGYGSTTSSFVLAPDRTSQLVPGLRSPLQCLCKCVQAYLSA